MKNHLIPLTDVGIKQAADIAEKLDFRASAVFVSTYFRTQETAKAYCENRRMKGRYDKQKDGTDDRSKEQQ